MFFFETLHHLAHLHFAYNSDPEIPHACWTHKSLAHLGDEAYDLYLPSELCVCDCALEPFVGGGGHPGCLMLLQCQIHEVVDRWHTWPEWEAPDGSSISPLMWNVYFRHWPPSAQHELLFPLKTNCTGSWVTKLLEQNGVCKDFTPIDIQLTFILSASPTDIPPIPRWVHALVDGRIVPPLPVVGEYIFHFQGQEPPAIWQALEATRAALPDSDPTKPCHVYIAYNAWPENPTPLQPCILVQV